jgi:phosphoenolpyruvate synthase/pyruvate phosphate dikinase
VIGAALPLSQWPKRGAREVEVATPGTVLTGTGGAGGVARGRARVVLDPSDPFALEPGDILIAPNTDPAWTPLFVPAAGVVVEVGAVGSHAMIISRELGIPCVVSVQDATRRIPADAMIILDGTAGTVTVEAAEPATASG